MQEFWGLIEYKAQWTLTIKGWLSILIFFSTIILLIFTQIRSFLAYTAPIEADILVVEGWTRDDVIKQSIKEFEQGNYKLLITTGLPLPKGYYLSGYKNHAELTAATLIALGFPSDKLVAVPGEIVNVNRTGACATALYKWLVTNQIETKGINLYSFDVHTRRSWLVFKKVLAPLSVGAIAIPSTDYDIKKWWASSNGFRSVTSEIIAYIYVKSFFNSAQIKPPVI